MGRKSKKEGIYVYMWLIHFTLQQKLTQHCKASTLQFKKKKKKRSNRSTLNPFIHVISSIFSKQVTPDPIHLFQKDSKGFVFGKMELPREKAPNTDIWEGPFSEKASSSTSDAGVSPRNPHTCWGQASPSALHFTCIKEQPARAHQVLQRNHHQGQDNSGRRGILF